jgi:biotin carboxylase
MRLLLLTTTTGYQTREFVRAAEKLGWETVFASDRCHRLDDPWRDGALPVKFEKPDETAGAVVRYAHSKPLDALVALGDGAVPAAARACRALGLPGHPPEAADACADKFLSRQRLREAGVQVPRFCRFPLSASPQEAVAVAERQVGFPCVVKPLALAASRGVMRADNPVEFRAAFGRLRALLVSAELRARRPAASNFIQAESYVEGREFALEGLAERGRLRTLALFDKPDPLEGPYFEETIYVTPSRLPAAEQERIVGAAQGAARALGLHHGPWHAEVRLNARGVWVLEVAARSIGGLCARALRFRSPQRGENVSLEEVIVRLAHGEDLNALRREEAASGVMMIPVTEGGILQEVRGLEAARATPGVEEIVITAKPRQQLVPWPEGASYPGFIFARAATPEDAERALRRAHAELRFVIAPALPVV